jgi:hypothetical protein
LETVKAGRLFPILFVCCRIEEMTDRVCDSYRSNALIEELFSDDWALRTFAGLNNPTAAPQVLSRRDLARYEGRYTAEAIESDGAVAKTVCELRGTGVLARHDRVSRDGGCPAGR